jgi:predicted RNA-binding protein with PUA-like domain
MNYWLVKTEPSAYSIEDLKREKKTLWHGVRNYQARNYLRAMDIGDKVFIYYSAVEPTGIFGLAVVSKKAAADPSQFEKKSGYYDAKATKDSPRWFAPEFAFDKVFAPPLLRDEIKKEKSLVKMVLLQKGSRLSVQPVTGAEFNKLISLAENPSGADLRSKAGVAISHG